MIFPWPFVSQTSSALAGLIAALAAKALPVGEISAAVVAPFPLTVALNLYHVFTFLAR